MTQTAEPAPPAELAKIARENSIEMQVAMPIIKAFQPHYDELVKLVGQSQTIQGRPESRASDAKAARTARLAIAKCRIGMDHVREDQKSIFLRMGKAIQGIFNKGKGIAEPEESRLLDIEQFAEREEERLKAARLEGRAAILKTLGADAQNYNLLDMPEDVFKTLVKTLEDARDHQLEEARKLQEAQREIDELEAAERERARLENERLRKEAEAREAQLAEERRAADARVAEEKRKADEFFAAEKNRRDAEFRAQQAASDEKLRLERQEREAEQARAEEKLRQERAAAAALQQKHAAEIERQRRELEAAQAAERERQAREAEIQSQEKARQRMAAMAPDKDKLKAYCEAVIATPMPALESAEARALLSEFTVHFNKVMTWLSGRAKSL